MPVAVAIFGVESLRLFVVPSAPVVSTGKESSNYDAIITTELTCLPLEWLV